MAEAIENTDVHQIEHQEELNDSQLTAVYGIGHRILRDSARVHGRIKGPPPLAHIRTGRQQQPELGAAAGPGASGSQTGGTASRRTCHLSAHQPQN